MTQKEREELIEEIAFRLVKAVTAYIEDGKITPFMDGMGQGTANLVALRAMKDYRDAWVKYLEPMGSRSLGSWINMGPDEWVDGFIERWYTEKILYEAEKLAESYIVGLDENYAGDFQDFWRTIREQVFDSETDSSLQAREYRDAEGSFWVSQFEKWKKNDIPASQDLPLGQEPAIEFLQKQLTNAAILDSGNRIQSFKQSVTEGEMNYATSILEERFGEEAKNLFLEILEGLDEQEQSRIGAAPKRKKKEKVVEAKAVEVVEEEVDLDNLDFLDEDIEDVVNLEELEDELNLDDLNLD